LGLLFKQSYLIANLGGTLEPLLANCLLQCGPQIAKVALQPQSLLRSHRRASGVPGAAVNMAENAAQLVLEVREAVTATKLALAGKALVG